MAKPTIINKFGTMQGWNDVTVNLLGRDLEGITQLAYNDKVNKENVRGAGSYPIGRSRGNYEAEASITLLKEEVDALQLSVGPGNRIQDIAPFDIPVIYELPNGIIRTDILHNCEFTDKGIDVKQGDGTIAVQLPLIISHITWI